MKTFTGPGLFTFLKRKCSFLWSSVPVNWILLGYIYSISTYIVHYFPVFNVWTTAQLPSSFL